MLASTEEEVVAGESETTRPLSEQNGLAQALECIAALQLDGMLEKAAAAAVQEHLMGRIAACAQHTFNDSVLRACLQIADVLPLHTLMPPRVSAVCSVASCMIAMQSTFCWGPPSQS